MAVIQDTAPAGLTLVSRLMYWILGLIEAILAFRVLFSLLGANRDNPFAQFVYNLSAPLAEPFFTLFGYEPRYGASHLELGTIVAMIVYAVVFAGVVSLLSLPRRDPDL